MEIKYVKLGEQCSKIGSGATPKGGSSVYIDSGVSLIRSQNVYNLHFSYSGLAHICDSAANKLKSVTVKKDDVLLNITGDSVARTCVVPDNVLPARVNQHVAIVRPNNDVDSRYLNYYLASPAMQGYLLNIASTGASRNAITKAMIEKLIIPIPTLPIQRRIASILSAYDNLIENNNRRIRLLEQMAENLYKEWFVRFRFPGHEKVEMENGLPKGWPIKKLGEFIKFERGVGYGSKDIENGENVLLSMNNIRPYGGFIRDYSRSFSGKYKEFQKVKKGDLIMSITDMTQDRRIIGYTGIVPPGKDNRIICTHLIKLSSETSHSYFFNGLFNYSNLSRIIAERATGANVLGLPADILKNVKSLLPPIDLQLQYVTKVTPILEECFSLQDENENLTRQRDLLLPRLMSGKLEVNAHLTVEP